MRDHKNCNCECVCVCVFRTGQYSYGYLTSTTGAEYTAHCYGIIINYCVYGMPTLRTHKGRLARTHSDTLRTFY